MHKAEIFQVSNDLVTIFGVAECQRISPKPPARRDKYEQRVRKTCAKTAFVPSPVKLTIQN